MDDCQKYRDVCLLTRELQKGKEKAFDFLFRTRYSNLCRFAATFVDRFEVAEDIVQDIFQKVWLKSEHIMEDQSIDSYLFVAVRNACFTYLRNRQERVGLESLKQDVVSPEEVVDFESPELARLWEAIDRLPLQCKVIFKLVILEEMKYKEVAEKLGISVNTVKTQVKIGYKTLRGELKQEQFSLFLLLFYFKLKRGDVII